MPIPRLFRMSALLCGLLGCGDRPTVSQMNTVAVADQRVSAALKDETAFKPLNDEEAQKLVSEQQSKTQPNPVTKRAGDLYRIDGRLIRRKLDESLDASSMDAEVLLDGGVSLKCSFAALHKNHFGEREVGARVSLVGSYFPEVGSSSLAFLGCQLR